MLLLAITSMIIAVVAVHLGLPQAVSSIMSQIAECYKCCSFWLTLIGIILYYGDVISALALAITMAYLSHFIALLLFWSQRLYNKLWQRLSKRRKLK
jgi:hypothetical protein